MSIFGDIGKFASNAVKTVGSVGVGPVTIKSATGVVSDAVKDAIDRVKGVPVLGPIVGVVTYLHVVDGINNIARGQRVDQAALGALKNQIKDYKAAAPYAASVVSFVPGVGQGVGSAIMAGSALAEGKSLDQVALEAIKGSIPGGPIAQMAFNAAQAAAQGKPVDQIAIASLPVSDQAKQAITTALALTKDLANGKDIDKALLARVDDAIKLLPPDIGKAVGIGTSVGIAKTIQDTIAKNIGTPESKAALEQLGRAVGGTDGLINAARKLSPSPLFQKGIDIGAGLMHGKSINETMVRALRESLSPDEQKGFDSVVSLQIGRKLGRSKVVKLGKKKKTTAADIRKQLDDATAKGMPPKIISVLAAKYKAAKEAEAKANTSEAIIAKLKAELNSAVLNKQPQKIIEVLALKLKNAEEKAKQAAQSPKPSATQAAGFFITKGLQGAAEQQKTAVVQTLAVNPEARIGATDAIKEVAEERKEPSFWDKILEFFGLS